MSPRANRFAPRFFFALLLSLSIGAFRPAVAHPSVGIVIAPDGDVFYSDLTHVWRIAKNGVKSIAVPNVHTHELYIDGSGTLFGEDSDWLGGDRYRHRIWSRRAVGSISDVVPWTNGFWRSYGLTRDESGAMYWLNCPAQQTCTINKRERSGRMITAKTKGNVNLSITWLAASKNGDVYFTGDGELRRLRGNRIEKIARISSAEGRHALMGISFDAAGNTYVANYFERTVVRVTPSRAVEVVAKSSAPWGPTAVAVAPRGELWILEYAETEARVRRIDRLGVSTVF